MKANKKSGIMNEKKYFPQTGDKTPFKVPEGYFEGLSARLDQLIDLGTDTDDTIVPERPRLSMWMDKYRPIFYLAAMFVLLLFSVSTLLKLTSSDKTADKLTKETSTTNTIEVTAEDYIISQIGTYGIAEYYVDPEIYD